MKEIEVFCPSIPRLLLSFCAIFNLSTNYPMVKHPMAKSQGLLQVSHVGIAVGHFLPHSVRCEMVAMQDILSAVGIPICFISAAGTGMPAYPKILGDYTLAIATYLGGSMRSNFDHCPTSLRRFVGIQSNK